MLRLYSSKEKKRNLKIKNFPFTERVIIFEINWVNLSFNSFMKQSPLNKGLFA